MEIIILIVAFFICYVILVTVGIRFLRALYGWPQSLDHEMEALTSEKSEGA